MTRRRVLASYFISNAALCLFTFVVASVLCGGLAEGLEIAQAPFAAPLLSFMFLLGGLELNPLSVLGALAMVLAMATLCSMIVAITKHQHKRWFIASHVLLAAYWIVSVWMLITYARAITLI